MIRENTVGALKSSVAILFVSVLTLGVYACGQGPDCIDGRPCADSHSLGDDADGGANADHPTAPPMCTTVGKPHIGLGGEDLASKTDGLVGGDRVRTKPYSALVTEYTRVLGAKNKPPLIGQSEATFGAAAPRWYLEPIASAVFLNTAFNVAFEGCLRLTGDVAGGAAEAKYATAPTAETAKAECAAWARHFWSREATPGEIDACTAVALESTSETYGRPGVDEATRNTTPKRRWAYACASVLTATGFLMY